MTKWTITRQDGTTAQVAVKATGTEAQKVSTAQALRAAGFAGVADENGNCITCDQH
jgi:VCBS repeat-containing protein